MFASRCVLRRDDDDHHHHHHHHYYHDHQHGIRVLGLRCGVGLGLTLVLGLGLALVLGLSCFCVESAHDVDGDLCAMCEVIADEALRQWSTGTGGTYAAVDASGTVSMEVCHIPTYPDSLQLLLHLLTALRAGS